MSDSEEFKKKMHDAIVKAMCNEMIDNSVKNGKNLFDTMDEEQKEALELGKKDILEQMSTFKGKSTMELMKVEVITSLMSAQAKALCLLSTADVEENERESFRILIDHTIERYGDLVANIVEFK